MGSEMCIRDRFKYFLISNFVSGIGNLEGEVRMKLEGKLQLILFQLK